MKTEMTNSVLIRMNQIRQSELTGVPAIYPTVAEKYVSLSKDRVRIVEAISRNRDYNEYLDRKAETLRREALHLYTFVGSLSSHLEVGSLIDTQT